MKILPDEIPEDAAPLTEIPFDTSVKDPLANVLVDGQNVFVSTLLGKTYVGGFYWLDVHRFTIGQSEPIDRSIVESARLV